MEVSHVKCSNTSGGRYVVMAHGSTICTKHSELTSFQTSRLSSDAAECVC